MTQEEFDLYRTRIVKIVEIFFPEAKVFLFGSRARGDYDVRSDFDIALDIGQRLPLEEKAQIRNMIEALNIPQMVDLVDFNSVPQKMKDAILKEGVVWKS